MNTKNKRREAAQKKAKKKRLAMLAMCATFVVVAVVVGIVYTVTRPYVRVFGATGGESITLHEDGTFTASLAHNTVLSGTFTEEVDGDVTAISFIQGGNTISTQIEGDVMTMPNQWRSACRTHSHATELPRRR